MAARDRWIGWNNTQRARNLQYVVNNSRFLILPWVQFKGLASSILARTARQLPIDWLRHYGYSPLLLETLVDSARFRGTCYRAANWRVLGRTTGRGHNARTMRPTQPVKEVLGYPVVPDFRPRLTRTTP